MPWKKLCKAFLLPHPAVLIALLFTSASLLIASALVFTADSLSSYISYAMAAYTLTVFCIRIPHLIRFSRSFKANNKFYQRWQNDASLRVNVSLISSLFFNVAYALLHIGLGVYHRSFWFDSLGAYYFCLAVMRLYLFSYTKKNKTDDKMQNELTKYRVCGWAFLLMNLALSLILFFMLYWGRSFQHHMITAIAMAAYTFTAFTVAIIGAVKYKRYNSPVFSATKAIGLAAASTSMLTLTSTMLTTFSDGTMDRITQKYLLGGVGIAVFGFIAGMAFYMILRSTKKLKQLRGSK
ncbi:MAG: hypothetical protein IJW71_06180 [Clostridia bacterium]|nr:hypothetical protein [Clostridia bacterium]